MATGAQVRPAFCELNIVVVEQPISVRCPHWPIMAYTRLGTLGEKRMVTNATTSSWPCKGGEAITLFPAGKPDDPAQRGTPAVELSLIEHQSLAFCPPLTARKIPRAALGSLRLRAVKPTRSVLPVESLGSSAMSVGSEAPIPGTGSLVKVEALLLA